MPCLLAARRKPASRDHLLPIRTRPCVVRPVCAPRLSLPLLSLNCSLDPDSPRGPATFRASARHRSAVVRCSFSRSLRIVPRPCHSFSFGRVRPARVGYPAP